MNELILNNTLNKANEMLKFAKKAAHPVLREGLSRQFHNAMWEYNKQLKDIGLDLFTKSILDNLSNDEKKLLEYLNSLFL